MHYLCVPLKYRELVIGRHVLLMLITQVIEQVLLYRNAIVYYDLVQGLLEVWLLFGKGSLFLCEHVIC